MEFLGPLPMEFIVPLRPNIAARVIERSRGLWVRISGNHPSSGLLIDIRHRIAQLAAFG